jgi:PAS domain S-box-containing protein
MKEISIYGNQKFFDSVINAVRHPVFVKDSGHRFVFVNEAFCNMYSFKQEQIIGKLGRELFDAPCNRILEEHDNIVLETGIENTDERHFTDSENIKRKVQIRKTLYTSNTGEKLIIGTINDITNIKEAEIFLDRAVEKQKQADKVQTNLISMLSHEFRTPLTLIMSSTEIMEQYGKELTPNEKGRFFSNIYAGIKKMIGMLDDISVLGRDDLEDSISQLEKFNLETLCLDIIREIEVRFSVKDVISFKNLSSYSYLALDEKAIRQILTNLLSNAIKYSARNKLDKRVNFELRTDSEYVTFVIEDNGIGLPEEEQARLFEPFYRGSNNEGIPGNGLGLAIVKKSVERYSGIIKFRSVNGSGTTFTVKIPIEKEKAR